MATIRRAAARAWLSAGKNAPVARPVALQSADTTPAPSSAPQLLPDPPMISMVQI